MLSRLLYLIMSIMDFLKEWEIWPGVCLGKPLDVNKYATKKTIAQGMLDIALLTANASQLKYVLQVGEKHEFYYLMLTLISISIILQVVIGVILLSLNLLRDCRLHLSDYHDSAVNINIFVTGISVVVTVLNLLIGAFDPSLGIHIGEDSLLPRLDYIKNDPHANFTVAVGKADF